MTYNHETIIGKHRHIGSSLEIKSNSIVFPLMIDQNEYQSFKATEQLLREMIEVKNTEEKHFNIPEEVQAALKVNTLKIQSDKVEEQAVAFQNLIESYEEKRKSIEKVLNLFINNVRACENDIKHLDRYLTYGNDTGNWIPLLHFLNPFSVMNPEPIPGDWVEPVSTSTDQ